MAVVPRHTHAFTDIIGIKSAEGGGTAGGLEAERAQRIAADAALEANKVNRVGNDRVTGQLRTGQSKVDDQAGTGERMVVAGELGTQRAEAKVQWVETFDTFGDATVDYGTTVLRSSYAGASEWTPGIKVLAYEGFDTTYAGEHAWGLTEIVGSFTRRSNFHYNPDTGVGNLGVADWYTSDPASSVCWVNWPVAPTPPPTGTWDGGYSTSFVIGATTISDTVDVSVVEIPLESLDVGPDADLRVLDHAGTGQRMLTALADGTLAPVEDVTWDSNRLLLSGIPLSRTMRGLLADRPAASASYLSDFYESVDALKRAIYRCDGSAWNKLPTAFVDDLAINVKSYGAIGDGTSHPLSEFFPTLVDAWIKYPHATALTDEIDWAATVSALAAAPVGGLVYTPPSTGAYLWNQQAVITKSVTLYSDGFASAKIKNTISGVANLVSVRAFPFQCFGFEFDANNKDYHSLEVGRFDLGRGCTGATIEKCRFKNNKTRTAITSGFYGMNSEPGYGNLRIRYNEFLDGDATGAIMIVTGTGVAPYPTGNGKGARNIDVSYNILDNVGGPCVIISNMDNAYTTNRSGAFFQTKFTHNYIKCNNTGTYGAVPCEIIGHDFMTASNNIIDGGTRGIGAGARYSQFNNNTFYNQTIYCFESGPGAEDNMFSGNIAYNCATFYKDTTGSGAAEAATQNIKISGNRIRGTGLSEVSSEYCIGAGADGISRGWVIENNTFEDLEYLRGVVNISGPAGSGGHIVRGNSYIASTEESTWRFCLSGGDDDIISNNDWIRFSDFSDDTPYHAEYPVAIGFTVTVSERASIIRNNIIFLGANTATSGGTIALGSNQAATDTPGVVINENHVRGDYDYIIGFSSTNSTCRFLGNDTSAATGLISIHASILAKYTGTVYSGSAAPTTGSWRRFDFVANELPTKGGIYGWLCTSAGTFGGTPPVFQPFYAPNVDDAAGTLREFPFYTAGLKRAQFRLETTAESGSDAGSIFEGHVYADNGTTGRRWLMVRRTAAGEVLLNTNSPRFYPRSAAALNLWFDAWDNGQASQFDWREGNVLRWRMQRAATSADWTFASYASNGAAIDTPLTIVNAANGLMTMARPLKFAHATAAEAPGANEVTVGAGDVKAYAGYYVGADQVVGARQAVGAALGAGTAGGTYGATEQGLLQAAYDRIKTLETALRTHGLLKD